MMFMFQGMGSPLQSYTAQREYMTSSNFGKIADNYIKTNLPLLQQGGTITLNVPIETMGKEQINDQYANQLKSAILASARKNGISLNPDQVFINKIYTKDEAFLNSVSEIMNLRLAAGVPLQTVISQTINDVCKCVKNAFGVSTAALAEATSVEDVMTWIKQNADQLDFTKVNRANTLFEEAFRGLRSITFTKTQIVAELETSQPLMAGISEPSSDFINHPNRTHTRRIMNDLRDAISNSLQPLSAQLGPEFSTQVIDAWLSQVGDFSTTGKIDLSFDLTKEQISKLNEGSTKSINSQVNDMRRQQANLIFEILEKYGYKPEEIDIRVLGEPSVLKKDGGVSYYFEAKLVKPGAQTRGETPEVDRFGPMRSELTQAFFNALQPMGVLLKDPQFAYNIMTDWVPKVAKFQFTGTMDLSLKLSPEQLDRIYNEIYAAKYSRLTHFPSGSSGEQRQRDEIIMEQIYNIRRLQSNAVWNIMEKYGYYHPKIDDIGMEVGNFPNQTADGSRSYYFSVKRKGPSDNYAAQ